MNVPGISRNVQAADLPLEKLAASTQISDKDKVAEVSRQFEAVLLRQILSQAQKPLFKSTLLESDNSSSAIYQDMITGQMADRISRGGTFGFARALDQQLASQVIKKGDSEKPVELKPYNPNPLHAFAHISDSRTRPAPRELAGARELANTHPKAKAEAQPGKRI